MRIELTDDCQRARVCIGERVVAVLNAGELASVRAELLRVEHGMRDAWAKRAALDDLQRARIAAAMPERRRVA